jgi:predicted permease
MVSRLRLVVHRYLVRSLADGVALVSLAVGIGGLLSVASLADQLVGLAPDWMSTPTVSVDLASPDGQILQVFRYVEYEQLRGVSGFDDLAAFGRVDAMVTASVSPLPIVCALVTKNFFDLRRALDTGVAGAAALPAEFAGRSALIHRRLASRLFTGSPIGQSLQVNHVAFVVVGVVDGPSARHVGVEPDVWIPLAEGTGVYPDSRLTPIENELGPRGGAWFVLTGRLKPGVSVEALNAQLAGIRFAQRGPKQVVRAHADSGGLPSTLRSPISRALQVSSFGLLMFLLVAIGNATILLTQRILRLAPERAVRYVLGARQSQLIWAIVFEGSMLATMATGIGVVMSIVVVSVLRVQLPEFLGVRGITAVPSLSLVIAALLVGQVCALLASVIPIWRVVLPEARWRLRALQGTRQRRSIAKRTEALVVVFQVTAAVLLLTWAVALISTWYQLRNSDLGLEPDRVQVVELFLDPSMRNPAQRFDSLSRYLAKVQTQPGVRAAALATVAPLTPAKDALDIDRRPSGTIYVDTVSVTPAYFDVLGIRLRRGRGFDDPDPAGSVVLNEAALVLEARRAAALNPSSAEVTIGSRLRGGQLVGVVGDVRRDRVEVDVEPTRYLLLNEESARPSVVLLISNREAGVTASQLAALARDVDGELIVRGVNALPDQVTKVMWRSRTTAVLSFGWGFGALLLAASGIFGVISGTIVRRQFDMAVLMALGATSKIVQWQLVRRSMLLAIAGLAAGSCLALWQWRVLQALDSSAKAPPQAMTFVISVLVVLSVVLLTSFAAARPLRLMQPAEVLRRGVSG